MRTSFLASVLVLVGCSSGPPLGAPTGLTAGPLGGGVHLTWKDNSPDEEGFEIERRAGSGAFARLASVTFDLTQFHDEPVPSGSLAYRVRAVAGSRTSDYSNEVSIQIGTGGDDKDGGGDVPDGGGDLGPSAVSFRRDIVPILQQTCGATTMGCHSREAYAANKNMSCRGWLALEDAALGSVFYSGAMVGKATGCPDRSFYERLTQLDAWMCEGPRKKYIVGGSTQKSQIYQVVAGDPTGAGTCNKQPGVPMGRMPPPPAAELSATAKKKLADWIDAGAPNN